MSTLCCAKCILLRCFQCPDNALRVFTSFLRYEKEVNCFSSIFPGRVKKEGSRVKKKGVGSKKRVAGSKKKDLGSKKKVGSKKKDLGSKKRVALFLGIPFLALLFGAFGWAVWPKLHKSGKLEQFSPKCFCLVDSIFTAMVSAVWGCSSLPHHHCSSGCFQFFWLTNASIWFNTCPSCHISGCFGSMPLGYPWIHWTPKRRDVVPTFGMWENQQIRLPYTVPLGRLWQIGTRVFLCPPPPSIGMCRRSKYLDQAAAFWNRELMEANKNHC